MALALDSAAGREVVLLVNSETGTGAGRDHSSLVSGLASSQKRDKEEWDLVPGKKRQLRRDLG